MDIHSGQDRAEDAGEAIQRNPAYRWLVTGGLICYGLIHLLLAWICLQVVFGGGGNASNQGALQDLISKPFGNVLVVLMGIGLLAMAVWQLIDALMGYAYLEKEKKLRKRISSAGRCLTYAVLGVGAIQLALTGKSRDQNQGAKDVTASLMGAPGGPILVGLAGLIIVAIGVSQIVKGVRRKFVEDDLSGHVPEWGKKLGTVGWCAKGASLALVGLLFGWAAATFDPGRAAGLDGALKTLRGEPFGIFLLAAMALGFACFGAYCFVWSGNARHEKG